MKRNINLETIATVERERERESYTLVIDGAVLLGGLKNIKMK